MLIATIITIFVLGGGGAAMTLLPEDFDKQVKSVVTEKERLKEVQAIVKQIEKDFSSYDKQAKAIGKEMIALNANYDAEEKDFHRVIERMLEERQKAQTQFIEAQFKLREQMTSEEWQTVF